jgi:hypothetical protein
MKARLLFFILYVLIFNSCKKTPELYNDCEFKRPVSAAFLIGESVTGKFYETDTIDIVSNSLLIKSTGGYDSIYWKIGDDQRTFNTRTVALQFGITEIGKTIIVKNSVQGKSDLKCFPNGKTSDIQEKSFTIVCVDSVQAKSLNVPYTKPKFLGKWSGSNTDNSKDIFTVNMVNLGIDPNLSDDTIFYGIRIYNLPKGCGGKVNYSQPDNSSCGGAAISPSYYAHQPNQWGYAGFSMSVDPMVGCCPGVNMFGYVYKNDSIRIEYEILNPTPVKKIFLGKRF